MMAGIDFQKLKQEMNLRDFAERELPVKRGRAKCPFGDCFEHGYNLILNNDGSFFCFRCHENGDVIKLASQIWGCDQLTAGRRLAGELGLDTGDAGGNWRDQRERRQRERQEREQKRQAAAREWSAACDQLRQLEQAAARFGVDDAEKPATWAVLRQMADAQTKVDLMWCEGVR